MMAACVLAGCASIQDSRVNPFNWFGADPRAKISPLPPLKSAAPVRTLWRTSVGGAGDAVLSPALAEGGVFAAAQDGQVTRFDQETGKSLWRTNLGRTLSGGVGAGTGVVVVGTGEGEVIALDASTGRIRWRARVSSEVLAPPAVGEGLVLVRCSDSRVFALDALDGRRRWVYQRAAPALTIRSPAGVVIRGNTAYAGFAGGRLVAIALNNGAVRWEAAVALPKGATELERVADVVGLPWTGEREICAVAYQGRAACFDIANGRVIWTREMSSVSGLGVDARYVFVSDERGSVHALDRTNGASFWKQDRLAFRRLTAPLPLGAQVAVGDIEGYVHFLSRENGEFAAREATDGSPIAAPIAGFSRGLVVQTRNGGLFALSLAAP